MTEFELDFVLSKIDGFAKAVVRKYPDCNAIEYPIDVKNMLSAGYRSRVALLTFIDKLRNGEELDIHELDIVKTLYDTYSIVEEVFDDEKPLRKYFS